MVISEAAKTNAEIVLKLIVLILSPPVPTISTNLLPCVGLILLANSFIVLAKATISSIDSPFILNEIKNADICDGVADPDMISFIA